EEGVSPAAAREDALAKGHRTSEGEGGGRSPEDTIGHRRTRRAPNQPSATAKADRANRRIAAVKASGWSRLVRCVARRISRRRGFTAAVMKDRSVGRKKRSNSPLIRRLGPGYAARRGLNRSPTRART